MQSINSTREKEVNFGKDHPPQGTTINTTNINIINYNTYNENNNSNNNSNEASISLSSQKKLNKLPKPKEHNGYNSVSMPKVGMMTITNKFPSVNFKKFKPLPNKPKSQQDLSSSITSFNFNKQYKNSPNIISLMPTGHLTGYKTFFTNKNDKYNFNINTNFNPKEYQNSSRINNNMVIEEEAEYNNNYYKS